MTAVEELFFWWPWNVRWALRARDAKRVSDFENLAFISEEGDDAHGSFAARALQGIDFKDAFHPLLHKACMYLSSHQEK